MRHSVLILLCSFWLHILVGQSDSTSNDLFWFLDSIEALNHQAISIHDSIRFAGISSYLVSRDSIEIEFRKYLKGIIQNEETNLVTASTAAKQLLSLGSTEAQTFLIEHIGIQRSDPNMIRPHDLYRFPCYVALFERRDMREGIRTTILSEHVLNNFKVQPLTLGNTAYLLSQLLDSASICEIDVLKKSSLLNENGRFVLSELKRWLER